MPVYKTQSIKPYLHEGHTHESLGMFAAECIIRHQLHDSSEGTLFQPQIALQELNEEKTIASSGGPNLAQKSNPSSRGSQNITRAEFKKSELNRAKSMGR